VREHTLVALDAGGTRTRCAVASSTGRFLGRGDGGPANHILDGWEVARASIAAAVGEGVRSAGPGGVDAVVAASAGVGARGEGREVIESLLRELVPQARVVLAVGDMVAGLWGALPSGVGAVVTAGTGSVALARNAAGDLWQVGGWGHVMGDEGSGYDVAVRALRAAARATDGRGAPTRLAEALLRRAEVDSLIELALRLYAESWGRDRIAALAAEVAKLAAEGDEIAVSILRRAGEDLALAAVTALRGLGLEAAPVSYAGSLFDAGAPLLKPFAVAVTRAAPNARVEAPLLPPLGGSLRLAAGAAGAEAGAEVLRLWSRALEGVR
jgi:N-acetylglucosamine kinase